MKVPAAQDNRTAQSSPETKALEQAESVRSAGRIFAACSRSCTRKSRRTVSGRRRPRYSISKASARVVADLLGHARPSMTQDVRIGPEVVDAPGGWPQRMLAGRPRQGGSSQTSAKEVMCE